MFLIEISFSVFSHTFRSKNFQNSNLHLCFILNQHHRQTTPSSQHPATNQEDNWTVDTTQWTLLKLEHLDSHHENLRITNNLNNPISGHKMSMMYLKMQHKCKYDFENTCFKKYQTDCLQVQLETELLLL